MTPRPRPTSEDAIAAAVCALGGIARGREVHELGAELADFHPRNNTFPGELLLGLAADALTAGGISRDDPLDAEGLLERYLPERTFRGRNEPYKIRFTLYAAPALAGGVKPDLLPEAGWRTDDFWHYALLVLVVYLRAAAEKSALDVPTLCHMVASRQGLTLPD